MRKRDIHYYLIKTARLSGWLLAPLMVLYIVTGFSLCGEYGINEIIDYETALLIHKIFEWPLVVLFLVHAAITIYFAFRRWGWIKKKTCK